MKRTIAATLFALLSCSAFAAEVEGVEIAPQETVRGTDLQLNGAGLRASGAVKIYIAALYSKTTKAAAEEALAAPGPKRVQLVLMRDLKANLLLAGLKDGLRLNGDPEMLQRLQPSIALLEDIFNRIGDVRLGDRVSLDVGSDGSLELVRNGKVVDAVPGPDIGPAVLKIWLGEKPVNEDLKYALLGTTRPASLGTRSALNNSVFDGFSP
ncbi:chalcone isomerase family protein [Chitinivorax sp. PXF-14]|uniref:chalcone isomerase family protein n=1 Tax=Chitinivorax sp. PXF-14 TaxID=3230488 RepID=UPI0034671A56